MNNIQHKDFTRLSAKEFLLTNGIGGYASGTFSGANTRRYHGLLVASFQPPVQRKVLVSKVEETVFPTRGTPIELSSNQYPGTIHPQGFNHIRSIGRQPHPSWEYQIDRLQLCKTIAMLQGSNTTCITYQNTGETPFSLSLMPLFVYRDYHDLFHQNDSLNFYYEQNENLLKIHACPEAPALFFSFSKGTFEEWRNWFYRFQYIKEQERGLDFEEDAYVIGKVQAELLPGEDLRLIFSTEKEALQQELLQDDLSTKSLSTGKSAPYSILDFKQDLVQVSTQFLVDRSSTGENSIIAGYHWFADWGRDSMIAMRGICISGGKPEIAKSIIRSFLHYLKGGLLPNNFPDGGETPEYNSMDATLWLFVVLWEYYQKYKDRTWIREIFKDLTSVIHSLKMGTAYQIHLTAEGFLYGGEEGIQITWMDAKVNGQVITPRIGCPVEINALWYNTLCIYGEFAKILNLEDEGASELSKKLKKNFIRKFWNKDSQSLYDVWSTEGGGDPAIRPNQIYSISLPFPLLSRTKAESLMKIVERHLLTPFGLRTLSPDDPSFRGFYGGDRLARDQAYHQGTVWPFLMGEYLLAYRNLRGDNLETRNYISQLLEKLMFHFYEENGLYCISEIFDGMNPKTGKGCIQQAWSIGMLLRGMDELF